MIKITPEILECYKTKLSCQYAQLAEKYTDYLFIGEEGCSNKKLLNLVTANALLDSLCMLKVDSELLNTCVEEVFEDITEDINFVDGPPPNAFLDSKIASDVLENGNVYKINLSFEFSNFGAEVFLGNNNELIFGISRVINTFPDPVNAIIINGESTGFSFLNSEINSEKPYEVYLKINNCKKTVEWSLINDNNILATGETVFLNTNSFVKDIIYYYDKNSNNKGELTIGEKANTKNIYKHTLNCFSEKDFNTLIETIKLKLEGCSC